VELFKRKKKLSRKKFAEMLVMLLAAALDSEAIKGRAEYLSYEIHSDSDLDALFEVLFDIEMWLIVHACELAVPDAKKCNDCLDSFHRRVYGMLQEETELDFDGWRRLMVLVYAEYDAAWSAGVSEGDVLKAVAGVAVVLHESLFGEAQRDESVAAIGDYLAASIQSHEGLMRQYVIE
jgi:hypothetical protein